MFIYLPYNAKRTFRTCIQKFIAMWEQPKVIYSDNATQLKAASKMLTQLWNQPVLDQDVCAYYSNKAIISKFITEHAPLQGRFHERLTEVVKSALKKTKNNEKNFKARRIQNVTKRGDSNNQFKALNICTWQSLSDSSESARFSIKGASHGNTTSRNTSGTRLFATSKDQRIPQFLQKKSGPVEVYRKCFCEEYLTSPKERQSTQH